MSYLVLILSIFSLSSFAATEGTIIVLEAPIFGEPDETSQIIQHYRKGDSIFLHPTEAHEDRYLDEDFRSLELLTADKNPDPLLNKKTTYTADEDSAFYKTMTKSGREAYVLKEHIRIVYKDIREFTQKPIGFDHTDYRIQEPLPKGYPILAEENFRGQINLAFGQPNYSGYPYKQRILDSAYGLSKEFSFVWSKSKSFNKERRFFFGAKGDIHFSKMDYLLTSQKATQDNLRLILGPYASYDTYRTDDHALNIFTSMQFTLIDKMDITIRDKSTSIKEQRQYSSNFGASASVGASFQFFEIYEDFDGVIGANFRVILPRTYSAEASAEESELWQSVNDSDEFEQEFTSELTYFAGIQTSY